MIAFGPSGWRGIIAEDFTFTGVRAVSQAIGEHIRVEDPRAGERGLVVGYDSRFLSEAFAAQVARVLAAQGVKTLLCE
ncbi:MAG: phosphoglucomutase/phosphomannomutase alpha/beta/alpha domain, partial [candidate division NC10 bacterium]|nr:phosphoglucomutase/phosphomannomutase alpha/beta/alpha domain [candidate division NC10 bacterium]